VGMQMELSIDSDGKLERCFSLKDRKKKKKKKKKK
jgi:hypothetical protein